MSTDAVVVGSGPNGLSAAIELARNGRSVTVVEANETIGGGCRSAELTLPGFVHDLCSAFQPMGAASPFFRSLELGSLGLEWIEPPLALAHPLDDGTAIVLSRSLDETARGLGSDGRAWRRLVAQLVQHWPDLATDALGPLIKIPQHPLVLARLGLPGLPSARLSLRHDASSARPDRRPAPFEWIPRTHRAVPVRSGRVQARLRARWAGSVAGARLPSRGDRAPRRDARRDRRERRGRGAGSRPRTSLRARGPAKPFRPFARARREGNAVGVLPRPERIGGRHDRAHRGAARAVRPRVPRPRARPERHGPRGDRRAQRKLPGRRYRRRRKLCAAALRTTGVELRSVRDLGARHLPLLVEHAAGWRRPRDVRLSRRTERVTASPSLTSRAQLTGTAATCSTAPRSAIAPIRSAMAFASSHSLR